MAEREYFWYLEPLDSYTNDIFARELVHQDCSRQVVDEKMKKRDVWECSLETIWKFCRSKRDQKLKFRIYNRPVYKKSVGPLRDCTFLFFEKRKRKKPVKALSSRATP